MNEELEKEKSAAAANNTADKNTFLAEIERLHIQGHPTRKIAEMLGTDGYHVGRNLREIRKRWARAAACQQALAPTQCATVYNEAMNGWQRSQAPKLTSTERLNKEKEVEKTINRRAEGPGDKTFLQAAVAALKALRQFAAEKPPGDVPVKTRDMTDREYLLILNVLTQDQVDGLSDEQLERMRAAIEGFRKEVDALRRKEREEQERQEAAVLDAGEQAQPPGESPPAALAPEAGPG